MFTRPVHTAIASEVLSQNWRYDHGDPSIRLFNDAVWRWGLRLPRDARVLELGCCETDFSRWLKAARPDITLIGCDVNHTPEAYDVFLQVPAETLHKHLPPESLDAVIALGSIEHFGLGFYGDPINLTADVETSALVEWLLKPGGWFYYDVPWTPETYYVTQNRHFRVYDDAALQTRLHGGLQFVRRGYANGSTDVWQDERPTAPMVPYWSVIDLLEKAA